VGAQMKTSKIAPFLILPGAALVFAGGIAMA
jgi:hypothetical protein